MEIYNDNQIDKGIRPQVVAFHLLSEPWLFTFDRPARWPRGSRARSPSASWLRRSPPRRASGGGRGGSASPA